MGRGNMIGKPNLPATTAAGGVWGLREQYAANRADEWPGYDPQWSRTTLLLKTGTATADAFLDSSSNNFTVTRFGDTIQTTATPYAPYWSNRFDGAGDYLTVPSSSAYAMGTGDFTVECWVMFTGINGTANGIFQTGTSHFPATTTNTIALGTATSGTVWQIYAKNTNTNSTAMWALGQWYHCAVVRASGTTRLYVNGVAVITVSADTTDYTGTFLGIGAIYSTSYSQNGYIAGFRCVKGTAVYTANFTPPTSPLTAISGTSLLTCQDNRFIDRSGNNVTITRVGDVAVSRFSPFAWEWAAASCGTSYFDGTGDYLQLASNAAFDYSGNVTVECWILPDNTSAGNRGIFSSRNENVNGWYSPFQVMQNGTAIRLLVSNATNNGWAYDTTGSIVLTAGTWAHVAVVRNSTSLKLYVNGVEYLSTTAPSWGAASYPFFVGRDNDGSFIGHISNLRFVKSAVYTANFTPPTSPVTAIANTSALLNFTNAAFTDTATGHILRQGGTPARGTFTYEPDLTSTRFNGTSDYVTAFGPQLAVLVGNFTVECWVYLNSTTTTFATSRAASSGDVLYWTFSVEGGQLTGQIRNSGGTQFWSRSAAGAMVTGRWYHVAFVRNNSVTTVYLDGVAGPTTGNDGGTSVTEQSLAVGFFNFPGYVGYYNGLMSNFRFSRSAVYTANFTPTRTVLPVTNTTALRLNQAVDVWDATNKNNLSSTGSIVATPNMFTGSALALNGSQAARVYSGTPTTTNFGFGTGDFTVEAWIYPTAVTGADRCIWDTRASAGDAGMVVFIDTNGKLSNYTSNAIRLTSTPAIVANVWTHVAVVRVSGVLAYFINGQPAGSVAYATAIDCPGQASIGIRFDNAAGFSGNIDELRVTKGNGRYTGAFTPPSTPFDRDWEPPANDTLTPTNALMVKTIDLPGATNNVFRDDSTNNFAVTRFGDTTQGTFSPFYPTGYWSAYFDGSSDYVQAPASTTFNLESGNFTWELWVNTRRTATSWVTGYYVPNPTVGTQVSLIVVISGGSWYFDFIEPNGADNLYLVGSGAQVSNSSWHHLAATRSGNTIRTFLDGKLVTTTARTTGICVPSAGAVYRIGGNAGTYEAPYDGLLSNIRLIKGTALYTESFAVPTSPPTAVSGTSLLALQNGTFRDNSTNNHTLTKFGDAAVSRFDPFPLPVPVTTVASINPGSVFFDGTGDYLNTPSSSSLDFLAGDCTIECWFNLTSWTAAHLFQIGSVQSSRLNLYQSGNKFNFYTEKTGSGGAVYISTATLNLNQWYHIALTKSSGTWTLWLNGVSQGTSTTINYPSGAANTVAVGWQHFGGSASDYMAGYISNLRMVASAVYTSAFTPPTGPLTAITGTRLLTCQDAGTITDTSTNNFTITRNGDAKAVEIPPFTALPKRATYTYGGSGYFDGNGDYLSIPSSTGLGFGTGDYTAEFWLMLTAAPGSGGKYTLLDFRPSGGGAVPHTAYVANSGGTLYLGFFNGSSDVTSSSQPLTVGQWFHCAYSRASGTMRIYVNGVQAYSAAHTTDYQASRSLFVGASAQSGIEPMQGYLSSLRVVKGTAVYTSAFTPPTEPVTAISGTSLLLNFDNAGVYDASGITNFTTFGDAKTGTVRKYGQSSLALDGTTDYIQASPAPAGNFLIGTGDFTMEAWTYATANDGVRGVFDWRNGGDSTVPNLASVNGTFAYYVNGTPISGGACVLNTWQHIAVCRAAGITRMFLNGSQVGAAYTDGNNYTAYSHGMMIGGSWDSAGKGAKAWSGSIEDARISRTARYVTNFTVPAASLPLN